jgi:hypothetical protein
MRRNSLKSARAVREYNMVTCPVGLGTKYQCRGDGHQNVTVGQSVSILVHKRSEIPTGLGEARQHISCAMDSARSLLSVWLTCDIHLAVLVCFH